VIDPERDSYGLALAWLDDDAERLALLLQPYRLQGDALHLLLSVLNLVRLNDDETSLRSLLVGLAQAGASRPDEPAL
jgi:hypothetical protein